MQLIVLVSASTINHAMAHKKSAMPLMRIARGESVGILLEPLSVISCTTLKARASLKDRTGGYHLRFTCHLLLSCLLYQFEFPTLFLAMREIIVNASLVRISPRTEGKDTKDF